MSLNNPFNVASERTVLITGAASPIGWQIAFRFAEAGASLLLHGNKSVGQIQELGTLLAEQFPSVKSQSFTGDFSDPTVSAQLADWALDRGCDTFIGNAAVFTRTPLADLTMDQWNSVLAVNLTAPVMLARRLGLEWKRVVNHGSIVFLTDVHTARPYPDYLSYLVSKGGLETATRALALELAPHVQVNAVAPGLMGPPSPEPPGFDRERWARNIPMQRIGTPDDIAHAVVNIVQNAYITGTILPVDGGRILR